jgi:DNA-directed RNA polymerase beta subunit
MEMEKDVLASHGSTHVIAEKFLKSSDACNIFYCRNCGKKAIVSNKDNLKICDICNDNADICAVDSTRTTMIFSELLMMLGIDMRMHLTD